MDLNVVFFSDLYLGCVAHTQLDGEGCFKSSLIHEFGHVIGLSHEQNRNDQASSAVCTGNSYKDPAKTPDGSPIIGNIKIGKYDLNSIMNYCNWTYPRTGTLSSLDKLAAQIYYGNMPNLNAPSPDTVKVGKGIMTIRIPSLKIGAIWYSAVLTRNTDANRDGIYDNVLTLAKTPIPGNVNVSSYPVTVVNGVMNIKMAKRTVISSNYPVDGKVAYLGYWELKPIAGTVDKWYLTSNRGDYIAQYPITHQQ